MSEYAWVCWNMLDYARICVNTSKSAWMAFVLPLVYLNMCTYFNEVYSLKEHEAVFSNRQNLNYSSWKYLICFLVFRLNIFTSKIQNFPGSSGTGIGGGAESWYTKCQYSIDVYQLCFMSQIKLIWLPQISSCVNSDLKKNQS